MSSKKTDILQIKQYLNGELDARAMHELEKRAQHDPFLMDALEGYETTETNQEQHLNDLQQRLQQRVNGPKKTLVPWPLVGIAASVVVLSLIGVLWYRLTMPKPATALVANSVVVPAPDTLAPALPRSSAPISAFKSAAPLVKQPQLAAVKSPTNPLNTSPISNKASTDAEVRIDEPVGNAPVSSAIAATDTVRPVAAQGYFTYRKAEILGGRATLKPDSQGRMVNQVLKGRVEGVQVETAEGHHQVVGTLLDGIDGQPLAGVSVRLKNLPNKTMTNKDGAFSIAANAKDVLVMSSIGYQSQEVKVGKTDSMSVALQPDNKALAEVAVVGYGAKKSVKAGPVIGWDAYKSYLTTAASPDHQTGRVKLSFTVKADGSLSNFKILNSLSKAADDAAIRHVKNGPVWHTNTQRSPEQVTLEIGFQ